MTDGRGGGWTPEFTEVISSQNSAAREEHFIVRKLLTGTQVGKSPLSESCRCTSPRAPGYALIADGWNFSSS